MKPPTWGLKLLAALAACWVAMIPLRSPAQTNIAAPAGISAARVEALKNLRFGMFVCWSFSTFSGKEWTPGVTNLELFAATDCDTDQWAKIAKDAGMGYILFLTKHHDGFCLWDTQTTDRKVTKARLGRDVLAALRKSCDKYGIKLALYFSEGEFKDNQLYHAGGYTPELKKAQLKELLTQYGPIEYIWFDHAQTDGGLSHAETFAFCKSLQPDCFIGFNHGDQADADIRLGEMGRPGPLADPSAAGPHMKNPAGTNYRLAEFTYPILPAHQGGAMWFYSLPKHDQLCLPAERIYADYLGAVKFGNIFSLDVGPDYHGQLREIDVHTLQQVGRWIRGEEPPPITDETCEQPSPEDMAKAAGVTLPHQPWHVANIWWDFQQPVEHFTSLEINVTIDREIPTNYNLYVSPCGVANINGLQFYGGLQSNINGWRNATNHERIFPGHGGILSRWSSDKKTPVDLENVHVAGEDCLVESAGYEGAFCSVRRPFAWTKGTYTYCIEKGATEIADGKTNTWFACKVKSADGSVREIGSLRFEGEDFQFWARHSAFVEVYSTEKIPHAGIPKVNVTFGWPRLNGEKIPLKKVTAYYPHKSGEPAAPDCAWIKAEGENVRVEIGPIFVRDEALRRHEVKLPGQP